MLRQWFQTYRHRLLEALSDVWLCSYPFLAVVLLIGLVFKTPQAPEITSNLHELFNSVTPAEANESLAVVITFIAVAYCALAIFFAAFSALGLERHKTSTIPYWLLIFVILSSVGIFVGSEAAWYIVVAAVVGFLIVPAVAPIDSKLHEKAGENRYRIAFALLAVGALVAVCALAWPVSVPRALTTWPIVYSAIGFWTLLLTLVFIALPRRRNLGSWWLVPIVWVVFCSFFNDDHRLRMLGQPGTVGAPIPTLDVPYVRTWLHDHCKGSQACTVRFVAAQGGGQRAAYWTQGVLRALNASDASFDDSTFAFSGISGGSIGGLSYYLARESHDKNWEKPLELAARADNLSPIISALLFREFIQAFIPHPLESLDRAHIFEAGIEEAWRDAFRSNGAPNDAMAGAFPPRLEKAPALFLNSARVEHGEPFVNSSLLLSKNDRPDVIYAADPEQPFVAAPIANSTAAHLSARFAFVNPHGTLYYRNDSHRIWGRLIDGGYFDGTGLITLFDVIDAFRKAVAACKDACPPVKVELTYISNDPRNDSYLDGTPLDDPVPNPAPGQPAPTPAPEPAEHPLLWELTTPITGVASAKTNALITSDRYRIREYEKLNGADHADFVFRVVSLQRMIRVYNAGNVKVPLQNWCSRFADWEPALGWWLSKHSHDQMTELFKQSKPLLALTKPGRRPPESNGACPAKRGGH